MVEVFLLENGQKLLNSSAAWVLTKKYFKGYKERFFKEGVVIALIPCVTYFEVSNEEEANIFKKDVVMSKYRNVKHIHYCTSNHPFYHNFFPLAHLDYDALKYCLKVATEIGIDEAYPLIHQKLKEVVQKG